MVVNVYWATMPTEEMTVSTLKYFEPAQLTKKMPVLREYFGEAGICPAITDEAKNTFVIDSPFDFHAEITGTNLNTKYDLPFEYIVSLIGNPNPYNVYQFSDPSYLFFSDAPSLNMTLLPPYYHESSFTENCMVISGTYDIGQWVRPLKPAFKLREGKNTIEAARGDPLLYLKFNTNEKIKLTRFDPEPLKQAPFINSMISYKNHKKNYLVPTKLKECYDVFKYHSFKKQILKLIKDNVI